MMDAILQRNFSKSHNEQRQGGKSTGICMYANPSAMWWYIALLLPFSSHQNKTTERQNTIQYKQASTETPTNGVQKGPSTATQKPETDQKLLHPNQSSK
jgi:hypothetical protein